MTHTYNITGMTCASCVSKVKSQLLKLGDVTAVDVQLQEPQATIAMQHHIPVDTLQAAINKAGNYTIAAADENMAATIKSLPVTSWFSTFKPILLILFYLFLITAIAAKTPGGWDIMLAMRIFMSGFFLVFSFFKFLDLKGFAAAYSTYDVVARRLPGWGLIYPFIELILGIAYAVNFAPTFTNAATLIVMGVSIIGVLQAVLNKRAIQCACLGTVFKLPMTTITITEDALMIVMSAAMLIHLL